MSLVPLHVFQFQVEFKSDSLGSDSPGGPVDVCSGAFAEVTGLEASMEAKAIKEGGSNYGVAQRAGQRAGVRITMLTTPTANKDVTSPLEVATSPLSP